MAHCHCRSLFLHLACFLFIFTNIPFSWARIHTLQLKNDGRTYIALSSFGFYEDGVLEVHLKKFLFSPYNSSSVFGFSLDRTSSNAISPYLENHQEDCVLQDAKHDNDITSVTFFVMDLNAKELRVSCSESMKSLHITKKPDPKLDEETPRIQRETNKDKTSDTFLLHGNRRREASPVEDTGEKMDKPENEIVKIAEKNAVPTEKNANIVVDTSKGKEEKKDKTNEQDVKQASKEIEVTSSTTNSETTTEAADSSSDSKTVAKKKPSAASDVSNYLGNKCENGIVLPITVHNEKDGLTWFETGFVVRILEPEEEGLYSLYFHNCPNYKHLPMGMVTYINLTIDITEVNGVNYLSAGQILLPTVYFCLSMLFFLSGCFWIYVLRKSKPSDVYKIHYLMALLVYVKSFSLLFHGINFHFIETSGIQIEGWAVLYYITHLLKGALLFITIVMIGTGWALIKHIISDKEKKIFMIVIPLQVLANVAEIIIEESEEGDKSHSAWREVFILVDLLCCGAILFPVVWSIRHLQEASQTDGKAAINLKKLKLFRHFYIMIVCYIYFTRIIVYLLKITVPFKYEWLDETFRGVATLIFFVMTGYKFRPASNNPYLQLPLEDDEVEMEEVLTQGGALEGLSKTSMRNKIGDRDNYLISKQESSHEYD